MIFKNDERNNKLKKKVTKIYMLAPVARKCSFSINILPEILRPLVGKVPIWCDVIQAGQNKLCKKKCTRMSNLHIWSPELCYRKLFILLFRDCRFDVAVIHSLGADWLFSQWGMGWHICTLTLIIAALTSHEHLQAHADRDFL